MIRVRQSHRLEDLTAALHDALPPAGTLFDGPWLVLSGRPLELYVDLELARRRGVFGNVDTLSLDGAFARLCAASAPDVVLINRLHLVGELLALLGTSARPRTKDPTLAPIDDYLLGAGTASEAVDRRRVQVARGLAALFTDWSNSQPERLAAWRAGRSEPRDEAVGDPRLFAAERRIWDLLFGPDGRFARRGQAEARRYLTLDALLDAKLDRDFAPPPAVHVFGVTELSRVHLRALDRLGARTALNVFAYNPCREFWEDLETRRRPAPTETKTETKRKLASRRPTSSKQLELGMVHGAFREADTASSDDASVASADDAVAGAPLGTPEDDNPFLSLWGRPGRDMARLLEQLCDGNTEVLASAPSQAATLLGRVQGDILRREPRRTGARAFQAPADDSLAIVRAPNPRREWETIAARIWKLVRDDAAKGDGPSPLRFCDIAVQIAGPEEPYLSLVPSVFREASELPYALIDGPLAGTSRIPEAILGLLSLPLSGLSRGEVLDVLTHPNIRAHFPDANPRSWVALCDALGIARGADREAFRDTYLERDVFNWDQGLVRLALGRFMTGPRGGADTPVAQAATGDELYLPAQVAPDFQDDADGLSLLARSLLGDVRFARDARLCVADWVTFVHALFDAYVVALSPADEAARLRIFAALDSLVDASRPDTKLPLTVARELVNDALASLRGPRGQILGNGVVIGTVAALRSLPFRAIFVLGLGPERFPAPERALPLDPGGPRGQVGDVTPLKRDRYLFLQTLMAARERVCFSYVDRDPHTGEPRDPSPVLLELQQALTEGYAAAGTWEQTAPIERTDEPWVVATFPVAAAEAEARRHGADLLARFPEVARLPEATLRGALSASSQRALSPLLASISFSPGAADRPRDGAPPRRIVRLTELRRFLECPLQGGAALSLRLRDLTDDTEMREATDEPFDAPRSIERTFLSGLFTRAFTTSAVPSLAELTAAYDRAVLGQELAGIMPGGLFGAATRGHHLEQLDSWRQALTEAATPFRGPAVELSLGRPDPAAPAAQARPALTFAIPLSADVGVDVELRGPLAPRLSCGDAPDGMTSLILGPETRNGDDRDRLRLFLEHLALAASDAPDAAPRAFRGATYRNHPGGPLPIVFAPVSAARARAYLADLTADALGRAHDYFLPYEAVLVAQKKKEEQDLVESLEFVRSDPYYRRNVSSNYGPVPQPLDYPIPSLADATVMVERRFGLFFELLETTKPSARKRS